MAPQSSPYRVKRPKMKTKWSMTVMMNARDLSRDDDFLSHLLVEHLGTEDAPLQVHKMDPSRRLPKHDPGEVMAILKKYIIRKGGASTVVQRIKRAVDALLELPAVKEYLHKRSTAQINAFATHASRYFELYLPAGSIEISHTSRYSHRTGKSELCILATTPLKVGQVITDLKGSLAHLTPEEDEELRKTDTRRRDGRIRRDFSVIHSNQKNKSHLFLGPARFVNHDCDHNVELFRDGRIITFRVIKPIAIGQEVTAHYGDGYFGKGNRHCLCHTCETFGRGGYAPIPEGEVNELEDDSSTDEETREERIKTCLGLTAKGNPNERRTRRGVYAILAEEDTDDEDRVEATEIVGSNAGQLLLQESANSASQDAQSLLSSNLLSGNTPRSRRLSDASSSLTSLSDIETPPQKLIEINGAHSLSPLSSLSSLSSLESLSSGPEGASQLTATASTSRRNTRASTASQDKDKVQGSRSNSSTTPRPDSPRGRDLRSSRNSTVVPESGRSDSLNGVGKKPLNGNGNARSISLNNSKLADTRHASSSKSLSKSATPVSNQAPEKKQSSGPKCETCSADLPQSKAAKNSRSSRLSCTRCKRHFAIYSSSWPDRLATLEPLSSESDSESDLELGRGKDKYGKKALLMEPSLKRRKTDSTLIASAARVTQDEYYSQYGKAGKHFSKLFDPNVAHRYLAKRALSKDLSPFTIGVKRKWEEMEAEEEYRETSLRIMASFAGHPIAKPLPALSAKPSPILFARCAWTTTAFVDEEAKREGGISQSKLTLEKTRAPSAPLSSRTIRRSASATPSATTTTTGQKRKRDSLPEDKPKEKVGKTFYMKGKKKMPKGWVLLSSSSDDEETDAQEDDGKTGAADKVEGSLNGTDQAPESQPISNLTSQMSEALYTPHQNKPSSDHVMKTPSIEASIASIDKQHNFSKQENKPVITLPKPSSDLSGHSLHTKSPSKYKVITDVSIDNDKSPRTRSRTKHESDRQLSLTVSKPESPAGSSPEISYSGTTSESSITTEQNDIANDKSVKILPSELQNVVVSSWQIDNKEEQISPATVYNQDNYTAVIQLGPLKEPDPETQRAALETSNYIHGTAFSFGHPDPRTSWKPKYNYSEVEGWLSDSETV